jgi:hypothetical protein
MAKHIYDKLFYRIFSKPERAVDLARNVVPQPVLSRIVLESVTVDKKSYVDEKLRRHFSDLLIRFEGAYSRGVFDEGPPHGSERSFDSSSTWKRKELYVYILFDHKSYFDKWVSFQLLRYVGNIYRSILEAKRRDKKAACPPERLPEVVPVVFYHGSGKWRSPLQTAELINYTEERDYIPHFEPIFYDLNEIDERKLIGTIQTVAALVFFKYIKRDFTKDKQAAGRILEYLHRLPPGSDERQLFERVVVEVKSEEETESFLAHSRERGYTDIEEDVMTFAEAKLREGRREGTLKDKRDVLKRFLNQKFGLSEEEAARIDRMEDLEALDAALDEIIDAEEKRQVLEKLEM